MRREIAVANKIPFCSGPDNKIAGHNRLDLADSREGQSARPPNLPINERGSFFGPGSP